MFETAADLPFRIRQSTLEDARCLFRLNQIHNMGAQNPESEAADRGTQTHLLAKLYVDHLVASRQELDWSYADSLLTSRPWTPEAADIFHSWARRRTFNPLNIYATEYKVRLGWDLLPCADDETVFSMDVDRLEIDGTAAEIVDYKTHFGSFEPTTIQAVFYPWMLWKIMPWLTQIRFTLDFVRWGILKSRDFTRDEMVRMDGYVESQISRLVRAHKERQWPASINSKCAYCRLECPLVEAGLTREGVGQVQGPEHAKELGQQLYALQRAAGHVHAMLRSYAVQNGPVRLDNEISLGFAKQNSSDFDPQVIARLNEQHGFPKLRALKVDGRQVRRIARDYPEYLAEALKGAKDRSKTVFKFSNELGDPIGQEDEDA